MLSIGIPVLLAFGSSFQETERPSVPTEGSAAVTTAQAREAGGPPVEDARTTSTGAAQTPDERRQARRISAWRKREAAPTPVGEVSWFEGSIDEAIEEGHRRGALTLVSFWSEGCYTCEQVARESFCAEEVLAELSAMVSVQVNATTRSGRRQANRRGIQGFPTLLIIGPEGEPLDSHEGYLSPTEFGERLRLLRAGARPIPALQLRVAEQPRQLELRFELIERLMPFGEGVELKAQREAIEALVDAGEGFDPASLDSRYALGLRLRSVGLWQAGSAQLELIRKQDPEGRTVAGGMMILRSLRRELRPSRVPSTDLAPLESFIRKQTLPELIFEGRLILYSLRSRTANRSSDLEVRRAGRSLARMDARKLWEVTPDHQRAELGTRIAGDFYMDGSELSPDDLQFALELARAAMAIRPEAPVPVDVLACLLHLAGRPQEALERIAQGELLDPRDPIWEYRRREFSSADLSGGR